MTEIVLGVLHGTIYGLIAVGLVLVYRGTRVINFAQGELGVFGLYIAYVLTTEHQLPWVVGAAGGILAAGAIGVAFEFFVVRRMVDASRLSISVGTVGLGLFLLGVELKIWGTSPRRVRGPVAGVGPTIGRVAVSNTEVVALVVLAVVGFGLALLLRNTDFGLGVLAASDDPVAVRLVGVPLSRISAFTWGTGAALAAVAALLFEPSITVFAPAFAQRLFIFGLVAALVGGLSSLPGAFVGGLTVGIIEAVVRGKTLTSTVPGLTTVAMFVVILLVLLLRPRGLLGRSAA
ncbi:MAG: branched-chain amino acid ABC transporter permease [Mycobacteriales bacterium]|nr:branched-chain amino acid ABC transporter permease [Frankia sp.]